jgi:hypothetical protein
MELIGNTMGCHEPTIVKELAVAAAVMDAYENPAGGIQWAIFNLDLGK